MQVLDNYYVVEADAEPLYHQLALQASRFCQVPMAAITLAHVSEERFFAKIGIEVRSIPLDASFGAHAMAHGQLLVVEDATKEPYLSSNPLVTQAPGVRFFAGMPLVNPQGVAFGCLCVMDTKPRTLSEREAETLRLLGTQAALQMELAHMQKELSKALENQKAAERSYKIANSFYNSLVEGLPQNIFRKDVNFRFTFANKRFCDTVGCPLEKIIGKTDFDFYPRELAQKYQRDDIRIMSTGEILDTVEAHQTATGGKIYVHVVKTPIRNDEGEIIGTQGIFWNVTERKRIEEELNRERDLLRTLLNNTPDQIYFKDAQSRFIRVSRGLLERFNTKALEDIIGKSDFDFFSEEHARAAYEDEQRIIRTGIPVLDKPEKETWPDGHETWALTTKMPMRNNDGVIIGTFGISKDITALEMAQRELQVARDAALETARIKSEFLANMSHEIRTPMNAIIGMSGLLMDTELSEDQHDFVDTIRSSADSLLTIINDILDFSKIEAGKMELEKIDFDLVELVEGTVELLATKAYSKGLELLFWVDHDVPAKLRGDPGRLRQVIVNLLSNAVKFTHEGEVVVRVERQDENNNNVTLKFSVRDTGIGIRPEVQQMIFQSFTQADGSTTRKYGGTGLGLAICKQLTELMGGDIGVCSDLGKGSTFHFRIPLEKQPIATSQTPRGKSALAGMHALIVDDNATNRRLLEHQLGSFHMITDTASGGTEALEMLEAAWQKGLPYDLIILDHQMPEMDGVTLARKIRTNPHGGDVRMLMLTSLGLRLDDVKLKELGLCAYLVKPVKQSKLEECLERVCSQAPESPAGQAPTAAQALESAPASGRRIGMRILVAEDNPVNQKVILRQLKKLGHGADAVANGIEVLQALKNIPYDVVLMDCQMPEMDGYEASRLLRERQKTQAGAPCHIIALTANALAGDRQRCLDAGMDDYISKPVHLEELHAALERAMGKNTSLASPGESNVRSNEHLALDAWRDLGIADSPEAVSELLELFLKDGASRLQQIEQAMTARNTTALAAAAHSLKGSSSNLGARLLASLCSQMEKAGRAEAYSDVASLHDKLQKEFRNVVAAVETELARLQGSGSPTPPDHRL